MKQSYLKLRSVRFKGGGEIRNLKLRGPEDARRMIEREMADVMRIQGKDIAGMAMVVWGVDGGSTVGLAVTPRSKMPSDSVPDFIRTRISSEITERWTTRAVYRRLGLESAPDEPA
jgi:hypothetical protein